MLFSTLTEEHVPRYAFAGFILIALSAAVLPPSAEAESQVSLRFGRHRYGLNRSHSVLGAEYNYRFSYTLRLGAGADYLSPDFGGSATDFFANRFSAGPNYQLSFGCLPLNVVPGVGLEYLRFRGSEFENEEAFGFYVRAKLLLRLMSALHAGVTFRRSWNRLESLGQEGALELQVNF